MPAIIHIIGYWLTKAYGAKQSKNILLSLLEDVHSLSIQHEIVINALLSGTRDIEDAFQYYTAIHHKLDFFISGDKLFKKKAVLFCQCTQQRNFLIRFNFRLFLNQAAIEWYWNLNQKLLKHSFDSFGFYLNLFSENSGTPY